MFGFSRCGESRPRDLPASADPSAFATLERLRHSHHRQGRTQHPFDKEQTLFLVQLCLAVFRLVLVQKEQCTNVCAKITPIHLLERNNQETRWVVEPHTHEKTLELSVLLEVWVSPVVLRHVGVEHHLMCEFQHQATVLFVLVT